MMDSDVEIIRQVRQGNRQAYGALVERYERLVRATAMRLTRDRHAAEDVAQEAFVAGLRQLDSLRDPAKFAGWLLTITARVAAKAGRRRVQVTAGDLDALASDRAEPLSEESHALMQLVERLPVHERVVVALRYLDGHDMQQIAGITGRPIGTVTKQLSRACHRLRTWLQSEVTL
jgi:RNA polymerase sigma-70 factor (ECF subfamily)